MKRRGKTGRESLTRARFDALFEEGGRDLAWDDVQAELAAAREAAFRDGRAAAEEARERRRRFWSGLRGIAGNHVTDVGTAVGLLALGWLLWGLCGASVHQGARELAACRHGDTLACQEAVQDCGTGGSLSDRKALYLTAYKQATRHALPPMEKAE